MYDVTLQDCDVNLAKLIYTASSDRMRFIYGIVGALFVHWFLPENVRILKRLLAKEDPADEVRLSLFLGVKLPEK